MGARGILTLAALVVAIFFQHFANVGARSTYTNVLVREESFHFLGRFLPLVSYASVVGFFVAVGLTALTKSARMTTVIGSVVSLLGFGLLAATASPIAGALLLAVGTAIVRICPYAIAAEIINESSPGSSSPSSPALEAPPFRIAGVAAFAMAVVAAANVASFLSGIFFIGVQMSTSDIASRSTTSYLVALGLGVASTIFVVVAAVVDRIGRTTGGAGGAGPLNDPYRAPAPAPPVVEAAPPVSAFGVRALSGVALLSIPIAFLTLTVDLGFMGPSASELQMTSAVLRTFRTTESAAATGAAGLAGIVFLVMASTRSTKAPLYAVGAGLIVAAIGAILKTVGVLSMFVLGSVVAGLALPISAIGIAYAASALRGSKRTVLVLAICFAVNMNVSFNASLASTLLGSRTLTLVASVLAIAVGITFVAFSRRIQAAYFTPPPAQPG